jgi:hypothetical protein
MDSMIVLLAGIVMSMAPAQEAGKTEPKAPEPADIAQIAIDPPTINLNDPRAVQRVLVTGKVGNRLVDLTDQCQIRSSNESIVKVAKGWELLPAGNGAAEIIAQFGKLETKTAVTVSNFDKPRPINFANEIVPIFTKLTCNGGGCHGKSGGQNGFRLSLLGFEPRQDHDYLVRESRGRRLFPAAPEHSLLLRKATGAVPHGGGKLMKPGDDNYQLIVAWIRQGMPYGVATDPVVTKIEVVPNHRVMTKRSTQRLRVTATYSDGHTEDVSRYAQFQSNYEDVGAVDVTGKVSAGTYSGEAAIMARYQGQVAVFRATVPNDRPIENPPAFAGRNFIDTHMQRKWQELNIAPSAATNDNQFIRRVCVDLIGKLPSPEAVQKFVASTDSQKREKLIDELLSSYDYSSFMALKWGAVLQNKRGAFGEYVYGTHAMSLWLKDAFYHDMPYDQFVRTVLTATGTPEVTPPVIWFRSVRTPEENVDNVSQLFLGTRIQCARCHHHPFEKWSQDDYWGLAAFFSRLGRKEFVKFASGQPNEAVYVMRTGGVSNPKTGQPAKPKGLDSPALEVPPGEDPRQRLVDWMADPKNPMFARALVNRLWGHFFGKGLVDPIDDMRVTNPATNPELLDALAEDFIKSGFRVKHTIRTICSSATYQLSSEPTANNIHDKYNFARYYPRRLQAEVLLDAIDFVTESPTNLGFPQEMRTVDLPDEQVGSYFLDIFGRPQRQSSCECERSSEANLSQALHLLNSNEIQGKLGNGSGRAAKLAADKRPDQEKITELFMVFFARPPKPEELKAALDHILAEQNKSVAYQNIIWALLNTKEFLFNT